MPERLKKTRDVSYFKIKKLNYSRNQSLKFFFVLFMIEILKTRFFMFPVNGIKTWKLFLLKNYAVSLTDFHNLVIVPLGSWWAFWKSKTSWVWTDCKRSVPRRQTRYVRKLNFEKNPLLCLKIKHITVSDLIFLDFFFLQRFLSYGFLTGIFFTHQFDLSVECFFYKFMNPWNWIAGHLQYCDSYLRVYWHYHHD